MQARIRILIATDDPNRAASWLVSGPEEDLEVEYKCAATHDEFADLLVQGYLWDLVLCSAYNQSLGIQDVLSTVHDEKGLDLPVIFLAEPFDIGESIQIQNAGAFRYLPADHPELLWPCIQAAVLGNKRNPRQFTGVQNWQEAGQPEGEKDSRLKVLFDESPVGIVISDLAGRPLQANRAFKDMFGYEDDELQEMRFLEASHPGDIDRHMALVYEALQGKRNGFSIDKRYYRKNGKVFWASLNVSLVKSHAGEPLFAISMLEDITERKKIEEALVLAEERYRTLAEAAHDLIYVIGRDDEVKYVNSFALNFLGKSLEEVINKPRRSLFPQTIAEIQERNLQKVFNSGKEFYYEDLTPFVMGDVWLGTWLVPIRDSQQEASAILGVSREITAQKIAEQNLQAAYEKEKELGELKSRFVSRTSHEFRTPLSTILSSSELLEHYGNDWPDEKRAFHFHRIQNMVKEMSQLLDDILIIEKAQVGRLTCMPVKLNLVEFFTNAIEDIRLVDHDAHDFNFLVSGRFEDACMDERLLRQVLINLLSNAVKYSEKGTIVSILLTREDAMCVINIQDQGFGISPEDQRHLFERFFRGENAVNIPGTGLGLAIAHESASLMQGGISVNSHLGQGTTFRVTLPVVQSSSSFEERKPGEESSAGK